MKIKYSFTILIALIAVISLYSCKKTKNAAPELTVTQSAIAFTPEGGTQDLSFTSSSDWTISNPVYSWLQLSTASGNSGTTVIQVTTLSENTTGATRSGTLYLSASNGQARRVKVTQAPTIYKSYNTSPIAPDMSGMASNAVQLAAKMRTGMGINIGNTMESPNEADWVNSKVTESYIKFIKSLGFNSVRLPCNWVWSHLSDRSKATIDPAWLARVKEVVGWCVANDVYVILNAHGDSGWLENNVNAIKQDSVNAMQKAIWEQIATTMRDFDEHLLFAGANEPSANNAAQMAILNTYHETFIKAVRSTGGRNSNRVLVVQGPTTDSYLTSDLMTTLPHDPVPNRMMLEVHSYSPSTFNLLIDGDASWGRMAFYWGKGNHSTIEPDRNATFGEEDALIAEYGKMKKFVDQGIPVILGEYASWRRTAANVGKPLPMDLAMHNKSVDYWATFATKTMRANGLMPFWWEIGFTLDRKNNVIKDQALYDAIKEGYK
ncbi:cellulase family glycosylhydrolase [Mucilaginibacter sp.]|uniref:cellulase family glycosylhydrolase n=1 Tax=Mucilaginibacter sp. TaxID=1882438 RepID=UPI0032669A1F